jgi:AraC-like DNA-binding protein
MAADGGDDLAAGGCYCEFAPPPQLTGSVACVWVERWDGGVCRNRVGADGFIDLIWGRDLWVRGPDTRVHAVNYGRGEEFVGVRFRPGAASAVLEVSADELVDRRVALAELWGRAADSLADSLAATRSPVEAARHLAAAVLERTRSAAPPDAAVGAVVEALRLGGPGQRVADLAGSVGLSERQLLRRSRAALGYGPKMLDRIFRLQRFASLGARAPGTCLARLAAVAGFADQAHLTRESMRLAGETPAAFLNRQRRARAA